MASSDDEDLRLAMAMSLQQSPTGVAGDSTIIDLTSDTYEEEEEELRRAIALSIQDTEIKGVLHANTTTTTTTETPATTNETSTTTTGPATGFMGIDRKAMEQERLARLGKRKREPSPGRPSKQVARSPAVTEPPHHPTLQYPKGVIKRTFATKYPRTNDITLDELLEASKVHTAVISSFMFESDWLYVKLDPRTTKQIWLMNAPGEDVQQKRMKELEETGVPNLKLHFPPMNGIRSMHSKFMLLWGKEKLRVVVPTANMMRLEWGEVANTWQPGCMENSVFLIDLPRRGDDTLGQKGDLTPFGRELLHFLEKQNVGQKVTDGVLKFDFAQTSHLAFVHSIGGSHKTEPAHATGLAGLAQAVRDVQCDEVEHIELEYASASVGAINDTFLSRIYLAARGEAFTTTSSVSNPRDHIRIYFPTNETVEKTTGGPDCGGIISLSRQYYSAATFPKECLRDYDSTRRGMLSHNKLLFARGRKTNGEPFAWVYVGSANMSESAWGGQRVLKSGKVGSLNIRNWECGVVVPVPDDNFQQLKLEQDEVPPMSVFEGIIEVPFHFPGAEYEGRQPWFRLG
ncbi:tyrosyl-DNA phosphodiesterase domain-containing protein [Decorospora gaudefroyi]|uniref:Tyrosyl-DNA phosphodiesterase domain-containing protein n=1 Tax=Decorospora gaudefroyi TaxID=184978 RepID=A0A6A5KIY6_9PLEO|nr:tyrosyl-DNA phosphodiesterase domain-containing protein [Decorospora gaudefroyi]